MAAMAAAVVGFADWKIRQTLRKSRLGKLAGVIKKRLQLRGWDRFIPSRLSSYLVCIGSYIASSVSPLVRYVYV